LAADPPSTVGPMATRSKVELFEQIRRTRRLEPEVSIRKLAHRFGDAPAHGARGARLGGAAAAQGRWRECLRCWTCGSRRSTPGWRRTGRRHASSATRLGGCGSVSSTRTTPSWVSRRCVVLLGESGTGKTHLLIALGIAACEQGRRVRYATCAQLANKLVEAADERRLAGPRRPLRPPRPALRRRGRLRPARRPGRRAAVPGALRARGEVLHRAGLEPAVQ
jgi:hypothetical protein